jgi:hypothetical protein
MIVADAGKFFNLWFQDQNRGSVEVGARKAAQTL